MSVSLGECPNGGLSLSFFAEPERLLDIVVARGEGMLSLQRLAETGKTAASNGLDDAACSNYQPMAL